MMILLIVTNGQLRGLIVKVTKEDFDSLILIFQLVDHYEKEFKVICSWMEIMVWSKDVDNNVVYLVVSSITVFSDVG